MRIRWTDWAASGLESIYDVIAADRPRVAAKIVSRIFEGIESLENHPRRGRPGRLAGTRELVYGGLPYIAVYRIAVEDPDHLIILSIVDGRMNWPPKNS